MAHAYWRIHPTIVHLSHESRRYASSASRLLAIFSTLPSLTTPFLHLHLLLLLLLSSLSSLSFSSSWFSSSSLCLFVILPDLLITRHVKRIADQADSCWRGGGSRGGVDARREHKYAWFTLKAEYSAPVRSIFIEGVMRWWWTSDDL